MNSSNYILVIKTAFAKMFSWADYANPEWFWINAVIPVIIGIYIIKEKWDNIELNYSSSDGFGKPSLLAYLKHIPITLTCLAITFFSFSLARLQDSKSWEETKTQGIDMVISMDISASMEEEDFSPNRLGASKKIAKEFIGDRPNDRFGLVVFAGESFTQCPLTIDHDRIIELFDDIHTRMLSNGTAIGSGLATAVARLKDSKGVSKVIILLTDGDNNAGEISPQTAGDLAETFGIKVYTIGIGKKEYIRKVKDPWGRTHQQKVITKIDEKGLKAIAEKTGGKYYRATSGKALKEIYEEIDLLEKTELASLKYYKKTDLFLPFSLIGILLIFVAKGLNLTVFRTIE